MTGIDFPKETILSRAEQPMTTLQLITEGHVCVQYPGGEYLLGKGDVIGICEIASEVHFLTYKASSNVNVRTFPYSGEDMLIDLLQNHPDVAQLFLHSAFHQVHTLLNLCDISAIDANNLFTGLVKHYHAYQEICNLYRLTPSVLPSFDLLDTSFLDEFPDIWLSNYYQGLHHIVFNPELLQKSNVEYVVYGFLRKASQDFQRIFQTLEENHVHRSQLLDFYMNESCQDMFDYLNTLYFKLPSGSAESREVYEMLDDIMMLFDDDSNSNKQSGLLTQRIHSFKVSLQNSDTFASTNDINHESTRNYKDLQNSLSAIIGFGELDPESSAHLKKTIASYKALPNKNATDAEADTLRRELTTHFYTLYSMVAMKSLTTEELPLPVRLFLTFGYMDEELAGAENCVTLVNLLKQVSHEQTGIYTFADWLKAIYNGKKEPSRNEYEEDYSDYIQKQKASGVLSDTDLRALSDNRLSKAMFELRNMFPLTNKMTYGRLGCFCPVFIAENIAKPLTSSFLTPAAIGQALTRIKTIDYSLFYRTVSNPDVQSPYKELVHLEVLPDIILMPNMGIHGVMWQEIEGKRRTTPARMIFSIFHMDDLYTTMIRLAADYRWEICKRVQSFRWNDITTPSLTSEYYDYIQFYRKNRNLSTEAKDRLKTALQRAHNSFKEMFIRDYIQWILFESTGASRLNKIAREILFKYCTFSLEYRDSLKGNPQFGELCQRHDLKCEQNIHHLTQFSKKLLLSNKPVPTEVEDEIAYYKK